MLHELLLTMLGYEGDIFRLQSNLVVSQDFLFLHEAEKQALNHLSQLGFLYQKIANTQLDSDLFKKAVQLEIDSWLDEYRSLISLLELAAMKNEINLSNIAVQTENYHIYFASILQFLDKLHPLEGVQVLNLVFEQIISCGIPKLQDVYKRILSGCLFVFHKQLKEWLSHLKPSMFIIADSPSLWMKYSVRNGHIPFFLTDQSCNDIIFIGNAISILLALQKDSTDTKKLLTMYLQQFAVYFQDPDFKTRLFLKDVYEMSQKVGILLLQGITVNNNLSRQLGLFRQMYLGGIVEYLDTFVESCTKYKKKLDDALIPMTTTGINQVFVQTVETVFPEDEKLVLDFFSVVFEKQEGNSNETLFLGSKIEQKYNLQWPVNILISKEDLERYNTIFNFLLAIRSTMGQNLHAWQSLKKKKVPSSIRSLISLQTHFMNSLWAYIQMDIIDSQYSKLISDTKEKKEITIHEMMEFHRTALLHVFKGCFLNQSDSSKEISKAIHEIAKSIQRTSAIVDRFDGVEHSKIDAEAKEIESNFFFLFKVFSGIQDASASSLSKFLIRFDFNRWFSMK
ncbi:Gamma-tubulin complex component 4 [Terramyces sp. JEL0728]|nr:Gamma-tubulin complex component 4 [Terramyces sp. JEL0728]